MIAAGRVRCYLSPRSLLDTNNTRLTRKSIRTAGDPFPPISQPAAVGYETAASPSQNQRARRRFHQPGYEEAKSSTCSTLPPFLPLSLSLTHTVSALPLLCPLPLAHRNLCSTPPTPSVPQTQRPPHTSITPTELHTPLYLSVDSFALWMDKDCESSSSPSIEITLVQYVFCFLHILLSYFCTFLHHVSERTVIACVCTTYLTIKLTMTLTFTPASAVTAKD